jgi:hypothetical protein
MRNAPPLTYKGALRLLGKSDDQALKQIDMLLGGLILVSGASPFAAAWGCVDQKNEAITLTRRLLGAVVKRFGGVRGFERHELITAAHSVIVVSAFFDVMREQFGKKDSAEIALTEQEKAALATGKVHSGNGEQLVVLLTTADVPTSTSGGMEETAELSAFYRRLADAVLGFLQGLKMWKQFAARRDVAAELRAVSERALKRYTSYFLQLAEDVPEFYLWATLSEHLSVKKKVHEAHSDLREAIETQAESLGRLHNILRRLTSGPDPATKARSSINRANQSALTDSIIANQMLEHIGPVDVPSVKQIYQNPRFKWARAAHAQPADEKWWDQLPVLDDFDVFLASYLVSPQSVYEPMLVLGHPGAGKSLLARVLAAQLPDHSYITIRVPLRRVDAHAPILDQIQQALDTATNRRVKWADLDDEDYCTGRVVILDGLDELLQVSSTGRASYLQQVAEFQRLEAAQDRPVAFIVTSRTVVADRVRISPNTTLVKLEGFDDEQIARWLSIWREHYRVAIEKGVMGELTVGRALEVRELACQPLLLLMLALYVADPDVKEEQLGPSLSGATFYERILTSFVEREVTKKDDSKHAIPGEQVQKQMWRLGITAFAMFNRDRLYIHDHELGSDLIALTDGSNPDSNTTSVQAKIGRETIGRFFFVYAAEADTHRGEDARRAFEFLHATFGEYLVAHFCVRTVVGIVKEAQEFRPGKRKFDDDLLFALLSHQTLATRRTTVTFIRELFANMSSEQRESCSDTLIRLLHGYRSRSATETYSSYRPLPADRVQEMAAYSVNLVLLAVLACDQGSVDLVRLVPKGRPQDWWRSTASLWRTVLGESAWESVCRTIDVTATGEVILRTDDLPDNGSEVMFLRFTKNEQDLTTYHLGSAVLGHLMRADNLPPVVGLVSFLVYAANHPTFPNESVRQQHLEVARTLRKLQISDGALLYNAIVRYLYRWRASVPLDEACDWIKLALRGGSGGDRSVFAFYVARFPRLLDDVPELKDPAGYRQKWVTVVLYAAEQRLENLDDDTRSDPLLSNVRLQELRYAVGLETGAGYDNVDTAGGLLAMIEDSFSPDD